MAVNSIVFGGVDSADYGIYISGEGVFDAPKRDVEMIEIPGRNGAFALDNGRFENIEVTYPAFNFEPNDYETFAQNLSDFRNALCSQKGYQRLTDSFHPDEYRMAVYREGLDVKPVKYNTASEFNIVFDCKPQRWLTSGESAVTVDSGDTLTNPTLFEASPLLEVEGYGTIEFNDYEIELSKIEMGDVNLWDKTPYPDSGLKTISKSQTIPTGLLNTGDSFTLSSFRTLARSGAGSTLPISPSNPTVSCSGITGATASGATETYSYGSTYSLSVKLTVNIPAINFVYGTSKSESCVSSISCSYTTGSASGTVSYNLTISISYDGDSTLTITWSNPSNAILTFAFPAATGISSVEITGNIIFIDCDLGECYLINGGEPLSLNHLVDLGSKLPTLSSGNNTITFDNTITSFKVTPRWWKI